MDIVEGFQVKCFIVVSEIFIYFILLYWI